MKFVKELQARLKEVLRKRHAQAAHAQRPVRDWFIILGMTMLTAVALVAVGVATWLSVRSVDARSTDRPMRAMPLDEQELESVLSLYRQRAEEFERLRGAKPLAPDPGMVTTIEQNAAQLTSEEQTAPTSEGSASADEE